MAQKCRNNQLSKESDDGDFNVINLFKECFAETSKWKDYLVVIE